MLLGLRSGPGQRSLVSGSGSTIDAITYIHQQFCILHIYYLSGCFAVFNTALCLTN